MSDYLLEMRNIEKSFMGVHAVKGVSLGVKPGTVHALLGENGAGKSTMMKILMGVYRPDRGEIIWDGAQLVTNGVRDTLNKGISMIYQELSPLPNMCVAENIFLGREPKKKSGFVDYKTMYRDAQALLDELQIDNVTPNQKMKDLTTAKIQLVEIAKAISYHSKLIVMDEPTSSLTESECDHLFHVVDMLKAKGVAFIFISHKMDEVFRLTDEMTIMRDGEWIWSGSIKDIDRERIVTLMVGREVKQLYPKRQAMIGETAIRGENLSRGREFQKINFEAKKGEIVGFSGLVGAGRSELMESVFGYRRLDEGNLFLNEQKVVIKNPADAIKHKIALLTEDRKRTGLFLSLSVKDNMTMPSLKRYLKGPFLNHKMMLEDCNRQKENFLLKTDSFRQIIRNLSGGNQQKVLVSRWLLTEPEIIILDEPTRGIDVGAKADIYRFIANLAAEGKCIIMVSSEMPELLGMCDRIYTMHEGKLTGCIDAKEATQEKLLRMVTEDVIEAQEELK